MARISSYGEDTQVNENDLLVGTDGGTGEAGTAGPTRNFPVENLTNYILTGSSGIPPVEGVFPISNGQTLRASGISQAITRNIDTMEVESIGTITVDNDIQFNGNILDGNGEVLFAAPVEEGEDAGDVVITPGPYNTGIITSSYTVAVPLSANTVYVITEAPTGELLLPGSPQNGSWVKISNLTDTLGVTISANNNSFMNETVQDAPRLVLDDHTASFELIYIADLTNPGWVIVGAQSTA